MKLLTTDQTDPPPGQRRSLPFEGCATVGQIQKDDPPEALGGLLRETGQSHYKPKMPRILLCALIGAFLTTPARAACNAACTSCFGPLISQCTGCVTSTHILQGNTCITKATGCSAGYKLSPPLTTDVGYTGKCQKWLCNGDPTTGANAITDEYCQECYDNGTNAYQSCTKCISPYVLQDNKCQATCNSGFAADPNDRICKRTIYDVDNACKPGTLNIQEAASLETQCLPCGAGLYCESFANAVGGQFCLEGFYCQSQSSLRSPIKDYDSERAPNPPNTKWPLPYATVTGSLFYSDAVTTQTYSVYYAANQTPRNYFQGYSDADGNAANGAESPLNDVCQPGTYAPQQSRRCSNCGGGLYCPNEWMSTEDTTKQCRAGFYCVSGVTKPTPNNPLDLVTPSKFNVNTVKLDVTTNIASGGKFQMEKLEAIGQTNGSICPVGDYCIVNQSQSKQCDPGFFLSYQGAEAQSECMSCPAGMYCPTSGFPDPWNCIKAADKNNPWVKTDFKCTLTAPDVQYQCTAGYFCAGGSSLAEATPCEMDHYCPQGTNTMKRCNLNEYTTGMRATAPSSPVVAGSNQCLVCSDGKYCVGQGAEIQCTQNQFCSSSIISYCPPGTNAFTTVGGGNVSVCTYCKNGNYCLQPTTNTPCTDGFYCIADTANNMGSQTPKPNDPTTQKGGICVPGKFCKGSVSPSPTDCTAGQFCGNYADADTEGQCREGYYCPTGSIYSIGAYTGGTAHTDFKNNLCLPGNYCPTGSGNVLDAAKAVPYKYMVPCPIGTYNPSYGAGQPSDCRACPAGVVCTTLGLSTLGNIPVVASPTGLYYCSPGNYCPLNSQQTLEQTPSVQYQCSRGYRCLGGQAVDPTLDINLGQKQILCEAGFYQNAKGQSVCLDCPAGNYCDYTDATDKKLCPIGFYCLANTKVSQQYPCPVGTYGSTVGLIQATGGAAGVSCTNCDLGFYCASTGQTQPTAKIAARYHGNNENGQSTPNKYLCPVAAYCIEGSGDSTSCDDGTWTSSTGMSSNSECIPCQRGYFCKFKSMRTDASNSANWNTFRQTYPSYTLNDLLTSPLSATWISSYYGPCDAGYICSEGSKMKAPLDPTTDHGYPCPVGHFCQNGFLVEKPCEPGTYNPNTRQATCAACPAGQYCPNFGMTAGITCIAGHYCELGTIYPTPCPAGKYIPPTSGAPTVGMTNAGQCTPCAAGSYCENIGDTQVSGDCAPGFVCGPGSDRPGPYVTKHDPLTSSSTGMCPKKAYCVQGSLLGLGCADGYYQDNEQSSECFPAPPGKYCTAGVCADCDFGYYCTGLAKVKAPTDTTGDICPKEYYCASGSGNPRPCDAGFQQPLTGRWSCDACDKGKICQGYGIKSPCPAFNYCDGDINFIFGKTCPNGFFGNRLVTGYDRVANCTACTQTKFCTGGRVTGDCAAGYICNKEADSPTPNNLLLKNMGKAYPCPAGSWCSQGALTPQPCPIGYFTKEAGGRQEADCSICAIGYYCNEENKNPVKCPPGTFCEIGSSEPEECPKGSYQPSEEKGSISDCLPCKGGFTCPEAKLGNIMQQKEKFKCPLGHYCPAGYNNAPISCIDGSYYDANSQNVNGTSFVDTYVQSSSLAISIKDCSLCPENYYCPQGTDNRYKYPCPNGRICPEGSGVGLLCPPGFYCRNYKGVVQQKICPQGYYCPIGTDTPHRCQPGTVCVEGSSSEQQRGKTPKDCQPGEYLNVDKCFKCEPGFVCDYETSQKYPVYQKKEGGYECPPGNYCPQGTMTSTIQPCPPGTYRNQKSGKSVADCTLCPDGTSNPLFGQTQCVLCGRGATHSSDRSTCQCIGAFRTWLESSNECICQTGYFDPTVTEADLTAAINLDCKPLLKPSCKKTDFINDKNECQAKSSCSAQELCNGQGKKVGAYDDKLNQCYCKGVTSEPSNFCDATCQNNVVKAFYNSKQQIILKVGSKSKTLPFSYFDDKPVFLDGLSCPKSKDMCEITATQTVNGVQSASAEADQVFVDAWRDKVDPKYVSPYGKRRLAANNTDTEVVPEVSIRGVRDHLRNLQANSAQLMGQSIQCINKDDAVSWEVTTEHFPVYFKDNKFNTDKNFDDGAFRKLKNKLTLANVFIKSFPFTFQEEGVFAFADNSRPDVLETLVFVVESVEKKCEGLKQWPLTPENIDRLGITPEGKKMKEYDPFLHALPFLFFAFAGVAMFTMGKIEERIEAAELLARMKREKMMNLKHYFKKKEDRFDKIAYLGDMYKLMQDYIDKINFLISENERLEREQDEQNIKRKLKNKYSVYDKLDKEGKIKQIEEIRKDILDMLENLRTADGRTVADIYKVNELQKKMEKDEEILRILHEKRKQEDLDEEYDEEEEESQVEDSKIDVTDSDDGKQSEEGILAPEGYKEIDSNEADDWRRIKEEIAKKRKDFEENLDPHLTDAEKRTMMAGFETTLQDLERNLRKEKENQDMLLKKKQQMRAKKAKKNLKEVEGLSKEKTDKIQEVQDQINELNEKRDKLDENGIKTRELKHERETEFQTKMKELDLEREKQLRDVREEYLERIRTCTDPHEKERLLEEMGRRMAMMEQMREEEKARQESMLKKMLKDRQKKAIKKEIKDIDKKIQECEQNIDKIQQDVDQDKAKAYADEGGATLIDQDIKDRKEKLFEKLGGNLTGFMNQLNEQEKEDIKIQKARLQMEKEKEMRSAEADIDEKIDQEALYKLTELEKEQERFRKELKQTADPSEQKRILAELEQIQMEIKHETENEKRNIDRILDAKRKKRAQMLQIKKMEIENKQLDEVNNREIELNQKKFDDQMLKMDEAVNNEIERQVRLLMNHEGNNKEQALILICEVEDDLLAKKLKILMSKQFFDLTKYLGTLQQQAGIGHMIRVREIKLAFEKDKHELLDRGISGDELEQEVQRLVTQMETEQLISAEQMKREQAEKESELREKKETDFQQEKKDLQNLSADRKRQKIRDAMERFPDDPNVQDIGLKLLKRINNNLTDELVDLEKETQKNLEKARLMLISDDQKTLDELQSKMNEDMRKAEEELEFKMSERKQNILQLKKQNLDDRIKMAQDELTEIQIKEMRQQLNREYEQLEQVIRNEKEKQLRGMRAAMLERRIKKERKRKAEQAELRQRELRLAANEAVSHLGQALRKKIQMSMGIKVEDTTVEKVKQTDQLLAKLVKWQKDVNDRQEDRGGEEGHIWNLQFVKEQEDEEKARVAKQLEEEKRKRQLLADYTVRELLKRIARVEKISGRMKNTKVDLGLQLGKNQLLSHHQF